MKIQKMISFISQLLDSDQEDSYLLAFALLKGRDSGEFTGSDNREYSWHYTRGVIVRRHPYISKMYNTSTGWYLVWASGDYITTHIPGKRSRGWKR